MNKIIDIFCFGISSIANESFIRRIKLKKNNCRLII